LARLREMYESNSFYAFFEAVGPTSFFNYLV